MSRVIHFELPADQPERAVRFYENAFGWKIEKWDGPTDYWLVSTGNQEAPGIDGAITRREQPIIGTVNTLEVASLDDAVTKVTQHGGRVVMPRMAVPSVGYLAYCADTEGNLFGVIQNDPTAS